MSKKKVKKRAPGGGRKKLPEGQKVKQLPVYARLKNHAKIHVVIDPIIKKLDIE